MLNPNVVSDFIYLSSISPERHAVDTASIRRTLLDKGVNFEGRSLPVSLKPNLIDAGEAHALAADLALVRQALNKLIDGLRSPAPRSHHVDALRYRPRGAWRSPCR